MRRPGRIIEGIRPTPPPHPAVQARVQVDGVGPAAPLRKAGGALLNWWRAVTLDALIVGILWFTGLELLHIPFAPLWAILGALFQFIPGFGGMLALIGPVLTVTFSGHDFERLALILGLYGVIAILEGLVIAPYILHRTTRVPWWASFLGPIVLGIVIPFWGVLLAPPLLAVIFAFRRPKGLPGTGRSGVQDGRWSW